MLALQESADLILLDDYEARELARTYGLKITGTIGLLIKAKYEGDISSIDEMLKKLRRTGFWLSDDLYTKILRDEGEIVNCSEHFVDRIYRKILVLTKVACVMFLES